LQGRRPCGQDGAGRVALHSLRIVEDTILSIPNSQVTSIPIENVGPRGNIPRRQKKRPSIATKVVEVGDRADQET
jgi:hypothetical protein